MSIEQQPPQRPTVGRIVHYYVNGSGPHAAIVTVADDYTDPMMVDLQVFGELNKGRTRGLRTCVTYSDVPGSENRQDRWCWPPRA